jgi:hypothetical protein
MAVVDGVAELEGIDGIRVTTLDLSTNLTNIPARRENHKT